MSVPIATLNRDKLLAWLTAKAQHRTPLIGAIYAGLADRVRRGEFDGDE